MKILRSELLDVVYRFYPRGILHMERVHVPPGEPVYMDTEEHCRLIVTAARGRREWPKWKAMIRRLGDRYGLQDESLHLLAGNIDPAYSGRVWLTDKTTINFHVSLLGPYYGIQLPGVPEEEPVAREIAREIEATYPGYRTIPPEIGNEVVPDVCFNNSEFGECTIYVLLFSEFWPRIYRDLDTNG
jgi:hypothetical protein